MGDCLEDDNFDCPPEAIKIWNDIRRSRTVKALPKARVAFWNRLPHAQNSSRHITLTKDLHLGEDSAGSNKSSLQYGHEN